MSFEHRRAANQTVSHAKAARCHPGLGRFSYRDLMPDMRLRRRRPGVSDDSVEGGGRLQHFRSSFSCLGLTAFDKSRSQGLPGINLCS